MSRKKIYTNSELIKNSSLNSLDVIDTLIDRIILFWNLSRLGTYRRKEQALRMALDAVCIKAGLPRLCSLKIIKPDGYFEAASSFGDGVIKICSDVLDGPFLLLECAAEELFHFGEDVDTVLLSVLPVLGPLEGHPSAEQFKQIRKDYMRECKELLRLKFLRRVIDCPRRKSFSKSSAGNARRVRASRVKAPTVERPLRHLLFVQQQIADLTGQEDESCLYIETLLAPYFRSVITARCAVDSKQFDRIARLAPVLQKEALLAIFQKREKDLLALDPMGRYEKQPCEAGAKAFVSVVTARALLKYPPKKG